MKKKKQEPALGLAPAFVTDGFIVTQDGKPCTIANVSGLRKGGVLLPVRPNEFAARFLKWRDARRAVERTTRCVEKLRGSMIEEWARDKAPALFAGGVFVVVPLGRQG